MEQVALNNVQLDYLARDDAQLKPFFTEPWPGIVYPRHPSRKQPKATL